MNQRSTKTGMIFLGAFAAAAMGCASAPPEADEAVKVGVSANGSATRDWNGTYSSDSDAVGALQWACGDTGGQCAHDSVTDPNYRCFCYEGSSPTGSSTPGYEIASAGGDGTPDPGTGGAGGGSPSPSAAATAKVYFADEASRLGLPIDPCPFLKGLDNMQHAYFFAGGALSASAGGGGAAGVDIVFDLYNSEAAAFAYGKGSGTTNPGAYVSAAGYMGYGFGNYGGVIDAWSGNFLTTTASASIPGTKIGVGAGFFHSTDGKMNGVDVEASFGIGASLPVSVTTDVGVWKPWNAATAVLADQTKPGMVAKLYSDGGVTEYKFVGSNVYTYLWFPGTRNLAAAILRVTGFGPMSLTAAGEALAIATLRDHHITYESLCL